MTFARGSTHAGCTIPRTPFGGTLNRARRHRPEGSTRTSTTRFRITFLRPEILDGLRVTAGASTRSGCPPVLVEQAAETISTFHLSRSGAPARFKEFGPPKPSQSHLCAVSPWSDRRIRVSSCVVTRQISTEDARPRLHHTLATHQQRVRAVVAAMHVLGAGLTKAA